MRPKSNMTLLTAGVLAACCWLPVAHAEDGQIILPDIPRHTEPVKVDSGYVENSGDAESVVFATMIQVPNAAWLRLSFDDVVLAGDEDAGNASYLRLTSAYDGAVQHLRPTGLQQWQYTSAYFNGEAVYLELVAFPGTGENRVVMSEVTAGDPAVDPRSLCGVDDRVLSNAAPDARIMSIGCTGWIIDDAKHTMLMAGHCISSNLVAEFNVPLSLPNGTVQHPGPEDQYAVDPASVQGYGSGIGDDWCYFGCFPNTQTGLTAYEAQGEYYTLADAAPPVQGQTIRIRGYGTTSSPIDPSWNQAQKTHSGPYFALVGTNVQYQTDTTGGNSGSCVFNETDGTAIGIHTHAGCGTNSGNNGTAINHPGLQYALANPQGVCKPTMDFTYPNGRPTIVNPDGTTTLQVLIEGDGDDAPVGGTERFYVNLGGGFQELTMIDLGGGLYEATFPASDCYTEVLYYFQVDSVGGTTFTDPGGAPGSAFAALTATGLITTLADNFETDMGWTAENLGATTGDWQRGVPVNDPGWDYDPASDSDGSGRCYLTQNQTGNTDVDEGAVRLTSPVFDMSGDGFSIGYDYYLYLTNEDGVDRLLVEATNNGTSWTEVTRHDTNGGTSWRHHDITQADLLAVGITPTATMQLRFTANDGDTQSIVEAGIDALNVIKFECEDGCPGDFDGDGHIGQADLGILLASYGSDGGGDMDGDGDTDQADLGALLAVYGTDC